MPFDLAGARHSRSAAKGGVTKVSTQIIRLQALKHSALEEDAITRQLTALNRANEHFLTAHKFLEQEDPDATPITLDQELSEHISSIEPHRHSLQLLAELQQASELIEAMEDALHVMELSADHPYYSGHDTELSRTESAVEYFRDARSKPGARHDKDLKAVRDDAAIRLTNLKVAYQMSIPPPTTFSSPPISESSPVPTSSSSYQVKPPKLEFPTFYGQIAHYVDWRTLFIALMKKTPKLSEEEKRIHLLRAMHTGPPHEAAVLALGSSSTFDGALKRLDDVYFKKRLIYATHLSELLQPDSVEYVSSDLKRMADRMELHLRGLKRSISDFTADQILAVLLEKNFSTVTRPHWRRHTKDVRVAPTC